MTNSDFIKLHRQITENELYREPRKFSKFEAWLFILLNANSEEEEKTLYGAEVTIPIGSFATSYNQLAKAWGWDKKAVMKYINCLVFKEMITTTGTNNGTNNGTKKGTIINVENWAFYQNGGTKKGTKKRTNNGTNNIDPFTSEFLSWYSAWPRQQAKLDSAKNFDKRRKEHGLEFILQCSKNYLDSLEKEEYAYSSNNFFGQKAYYLDYVEKKPKQAQLGFDDLGDPIPGALDRTPI